jgi:fructokinase
VRIGIDLGGTKIEVVVLDDAGSALYRRRVPTPANDYTGVLAAIRDLVVMAERAVGRTASVGIGTPGALSLRTGLLKNSNSVVLNGKPLARDLERALSRPVRLENDANCFALSEATDGAATGARSVFGVILGTGVGGGLVLEGRIVTGRNRIGGEWGHNPLPWARPDELPGPRCYCGKNGCVETFLSGPALSAAYLRRSGKLLSAEEIAQAADRGDAQAGAMIEIFVDRLARGLATVINLVDPDCIVLGGGLSNIAHIYGRLPALLPQYVFSDAVETEVRPARFGDSSGVRGAAWLWPAAGR